MTCKRSTRAVPGVTSNMSWHRWSSRYESNQRSRAEVKGVSGKKSGHSLTHWPQTTTSCGLIIPGLAWNLTGPSLLARPEDMDQFDISSKPIILGGLFASSFLGQKASTDFMAMTFCPWVTAKQP